MAATALSSPTRPCDCGCRRPVTGPYSLYAAPCRAALRGRKAKYVPTPEIDELIRHAYHLMREFGNRNAIQQLAKRIGWPKFAVVRRGLKLGLSRTKESQWSADEVAILQQYNWASDSHLVRKLKDAGFHRTMTAVHLKIRRLRIRQHGEHYSACELGQAFGEDVHKVTRWIQTGMLRGARRGTDRTDRQGGDTWVIFHRDVRDFALANPNEYDLAKVDKLWFLELVSGVDVAARAASAEESTLP